MLVKLSEDSFPDLNTVYNKRSGSRLVVLALNDYVDGKGFYIFFILEKRLEDNEQYNFAGDFSLIKMLAGDKK